jgi:hypothetical protein
MALASLFGLGGVALALLVWGFGGGLVWALLVWFFAGPAWLFMWLIWDTGTAADHSSGCEDRRCHFRPSSFFYNGAVNV